MLNRLENDENDPADDKNSYFFALQALSTLRTTCVRYWNNSFINILVFFTHAHTHTRIAYLPKNRPISISGGVTYVMYNDHMSLYSSR
jgi:hypothetical protein